MRNSPLFKVLSILLLVFALSSCGKFRKIQKSDDWRVKYNAAFDYYSKNKYYKASMLFEELIPLLRGSEEAEKVQFYFAYSHYYQKNYLMASHYFKSFADVYGRSPLIEEANYMYAYSLYLESPEYNLDQSSTIEAVVAMQSFINRYPRSEYVDAANRIIDELQVKLEKKAYENAKLYHKLAKWKAAIIAFENFSKDYPDSKYIEELAFLKIEAEYTLAKESIPSKQLERFRTTIEYYQAFVDSYPGSKYTKSAEGYYDSSLNQINKLTAKNE
jgi:outer membrane protein assembly factor BamD